MEALHRRYGSYESCKQWRALDEVVTQRFPGKRVPVLAEDVVLNDLLDPACLVDLRVRCSVVRSLILGGYIWK